MNPQLLIAFTCFFLALGACVGSFLNVVIWRLPYRGREVLYLEKRAPMTLSWPPSHCPMCDAPIRPWQNIPIVSWIALRARCANCRAQIPIRYPLVELGTALLFGGFFLAYFLGHWPAPAHVPFFYEDIRSDWPPLALHLFVVAALLAASAIDADLYIIPLSIPYMILLVALLAAPFINHPAIPSLDIANNWWLANPILGAVAGLIIANLLLILKILTRSFANLETPQPAETPAPSPVSDAPAEAEPPLAPPPKLTRFLPSVITTGLLLAVDVLCWCLTTPTIASLVTVISGIAVFLLGVLPRDAGQVDVTDEVLEEISTPHVRREILKELLFLAIPILCALAASRIPLSLPPSPWLARLLGVLLGALVGGGIVWVIRIAGSLGFNKEAMGMGDAHLMLGIGAVLGAPVVVIAFFLAPFVGIAWAIVLKILGKPNILPYGPWLSVASILCLLLGNTLLTNYLNMMFP